MNGTSRHSWSCRAPHAHAASIRAEGCAMARGFTLVELIIASVVTAMVAATAIAVVEGFRQAAAMQSARSETIVRAAGVQAHMAQLALKSRMTLELSPERILLWTPAESLSNSGEGSEAAFDRIDLDEGELHWLALEQETDGTWTLVEYTPRRESVAGQDVFFTSDTSFWSDLFASLRDQDALERAPLASRLAPPRRMAGPGSPMASLDAPAFRTLEPTVCDNRGFSVEFALTARDADGTEDESLRTDVRISGLLAFFDQHPICVEDQP
jgi:prepilin-type N-terminal cleavage/methylation domain-containing protein